MRDEHISISIGLKEDGQGVKLNVHKDGLQQGVKYTDGPPEDFMRPFRWL